MSLTMSKLLAPGFYYFERYNAFGNQPKLFRRAATTMIRYLWARADTQRPLNIFATFFT